MFEQQSRQRRLWSRLALVGLSLAALSLFTGCPARNSGGQGNEPVARSNAPSGSAGSIRVRIYDRLDVGQVRDNVTVTIGGITQQIDLDENTPQAYVEFQGPGPGDYEVTLSSVTWFYYQGNLVSVPGSGRGTLSCTGNADYELTIDLSTNPATISLRSMR